ncbi:hypothetical protein IFM89_002677 [Coptis chinensis]|uniref:ATPase AAA-type core domain-containing protein n=1 Tax=Coptis chinensis TaxID=261450 RepID=A0A835IKE7_9MAGN|nr:hypothetical protein IFM89_002677 [Coptis chinensis]
MTADRLDISSSNLLPHLSGKVTAIARTHPKLRRVVSEELKGAIPAVTYYAEIGKAWKRGYLLYGPPGTGKSTMIAAIANFLEYDIYDIEEEEKETKDTKAKEESGYGSSKVTLSGLMNFIDGLWSACAEERACGNSQTTRN